MLVNFLYFNNHTEKNGYSYRNKTFRLERQLLWNHAITFTRWQHPAIGGDWRHLFIIIFQYKL